MYILLLISLCILLFINIHIYKFDLFAPALLYSVVLLIAGIYGCFWYEAWELSTYAFKTYYIIMLGTLAFSISGWFIHLGYRKQADGKLYFSNFSFEINNLKWLIMILLEIVTIYMGVDFFGGPSNDISRAIIAYRVASVRGEVNMPNILSFLLNVCLVNGYVSGYWMTEQLVCLGKKSLKWITMWILSIVASLLVGSRGGAVSVIVVTGCIFFALFRRKNEYMNNLTQRRRIKIIIIIAMILSVVFFFQSAKWLGRNVQESPAYYLAVYLSAPLKNLDINIQLIDAGVTIDGLGYTNVNGLTLGNVGTVYTYEYLKGKGLMVCGISTLVGVISAWLYENVRIKNIYVGKFDFLFLLYAYVTYAISMVIFGTTLLDSIFSVFFLKVVACMFILLIYYSTSYSIKTKVIKFKKVI